MAQQQPQPSTAKQPGKNGFASGLAKILSAGQNETGMAGFFEPHQIIQPPKILINRALWMF